ncbi:MAG: FtsX-like permease family protein [Reinekea sp.]
MNAGSVARLSLKLLWRDWRGGELNVIVVALLVSVMTVTGIGLFSDRIQNSILDEASSLLAADAQITGSQPIPDEWQLDAQALKLKTAYLVRFQAMAFGRNNAAQLSSVKAVSDEYPLKGQVEVSDVPFGMPRRVISRPGPGEAWVNSRIMASLNLQVGDVVGIADADFTVSKVLISEPDNTGSGFGFSPSILVNLRDVERTGSVQTGSRVSYSLLLAGDVEPFHKQWQQLETPHHRWRSVEDASERVTETLEKADSFLLLAGSLGVVLAGVALALSSRRYATRQLSHVALLKTLGLTPDNISLLYSGSLAVLAIVVVAVGMVAGWLFHWVFLEVFSGMLPRELAPATAKPIVIGFVTGVICLLAFSLPPIWALRHTPPAKVLRDDIAGGTVSRWRSTALGAAAVCALVFLYSQSLFITGVLILAGTTAIVGVSLLARLSIIFARRLGGNFGVTWRLGLANLYRHGNQNSFQIMIFAVVLMLLFMLTLLRTSLLHEWRNQLPQGTPNHFAFNIFEDERDGFQAFLAEHNIQSTPLYPMIRGRLIKIGDENIQQRIERLNPEGDDYRRELNNTWSQNLAEDNKIVEGEWFDATDQQKLLISIEQEFAKHLEINLGDELTFAFGGQQVTAPVDNIRTVDWSSLSPNFYIIFSSQVLGGRGAVYLTSFYLSDSQKPLLVELLRQYPTMSVIEVDLILKQLQSIIEQVTSAVEFILALVLLAGCVVLVASIQATLDNRLQESAILRTLGAKARLVQGALAIEFLTLGGLAGLLAAVCAEIGLYFLQTELLDINFAPNIWLLLTGPIIGAVTIGVVGLLATRRVRLIDNK